MAKVTIGGDSRGLLDALQKVNKELKETQKNFGKGKRESEKASKAAQRIREAVDPWAKFNRKVDESRELMRKHGLEGRYHMANVKRHYQTAIREQERLNNVQKRGGLFGPGTFGGKVLNSMITQIASITAGWVGLSAVLRGVSGHFQAIDTIAKQSASNIRSSFGPIGELQQISATPGQFVQRIAGVRRTIRQGVFLPNERSQAASLEFAMQSAGMDEYTKNMMRSLGASGRVAPQNLPTFLSGLARATGPRRGGEMRTANIALAGASPVQANIMQFTQAMSEIAPSLSRLGFSQNEGAALLSQMMEVWRPDEARTRANRLLQAMEQNPEFRGETFAENLANMQRAIDLGRDITDVVGGEIRAREGYTEAIKRQGAAYEGLLRNMDEYIAKNEILNRDFSKMEPTQRAEALARRTEGEAGVINELLFGEKQRLFDAVRGRIDTSFAPGVVRTGMHALYGIFDFVGAEDMAMRMALEDARQGNMLALSLPEEITEAIEARQDRGFTGVPANNDAQQQLWGIQVGRAMADAVGRAVADNADRAPLEAVETPD